MTSRMISEVKNATLVFVGETHENPEHHRLQLDVTPDIGRARADMTKVRQLLFNLLSNACKFTDKGTITLGVASFTRDNREWIRYQVRDSGIGMDAAKIAQLFTPDRSAEILDAVANAAGAVLGAWFAVRYCVTRKMSGRPS